MSNHIDPRGPRFGASITSVLAIGAFLTGTEEPSVAYFYIVLLSVLFAWNVFAPASHPYAIIFKNLVRPRLAAPKELEDPRPPRFAQQVGFAFALLGLIGYWIAPVLVVVSAAFIFFAAFLNAVFNYCLGCQMYLLLKRFRVIR